MSHIVLLGDSIFDNERYVPGESSVIDHLQRILLPGWKASLLAVDGSITTDVDRQLGKIPEGATHLAVSIGGNDALETSRILNDKADSVFEVFSRISERREQFHRNYEQMLHRILKRGLPTVVCTVYDSVPGLDRESVSALCLFNDVILREAFRARLPVIDLRLICTDSTDYSKYSPIEPSAAGGGKIARAVRRVLTDPDAWTHGSRVFGG